MNRTDCQDDGITIPPRPPLVHERISTSARQLAASIEAGEYANLTPEQRCDLRALTLEMLGWAGDVYEMEMPRGRVVSLRPALVVIDGSQREFWR